MSHFDELEEVCRRPAPFECRTTRDLWTDEHISEKMLAYHLDGAVDVSSRRLEFIDRSAAFIAKRFDLREGHSVADFGCGPGLYTSRFAATGARVTGVDFSERSLRHAREHSDPGIDYVLADYLEFASSARFDLITLIFCDFCALAPDGRARVLETFRTHLAPGGALLLDVSSLVAFQAKSEATTFSAEPQGGFWSARPYFCFQRSFKYEPEKLLLDKFTIVEQDRRRVIYNWLQCFDVPSLRRELENAGFSVEEVLGDVAGAPWSEDGLEFAVIGRAKPLR